MAYKCGAVVSGSLLLWCREAVGWTRLVGNPLKCKCFKVDLSSMWLAFSCLYLLALTMVSVVLPVEDVEELNAGGETLSFNLVLADLSKVG